MMYGKQSVQMSRHRSSTLPLRFILIALLSTAICLPSIYQPLLSTLYQHLYQSSFYRFSGFESFLTVVCYSITEPLYTYKFGHNPQLRIDVRSKKQDANKARPRLPKMRRPRERIGELLVYVAPLLLLDFIMIKKFSEVPINDIRRSGGYAIDHSINATNFPLQLHRAAQVETSSFVSPSFLLPTFHNFTLSSPLQLERALPPTMPTSRRIVFELIGAFFIYDALFFAIHLAFHRIRPLARIHSPHHTHAEIHPQVTNQLSVTERLALVLLANFSLNIIGSHVFTRTCFVPLFVYLFVEVHCGMDLDWGYDKLMPAGWGAGPKVHAKHHQTGSGAYAPFFRWWDAGLVWVEGALRART